MTIRRPAEEAQETFSRLQPLVMTLPDVVKVVATGSLRRKHTRVKDLDMIVLSNEGSSSPLPAVRQILHDVESGGERYIKGFYKGFLVNIWWHDRTSGFGSMLLFATGSGAFNLKLRGMAMRKGMKLNRYGLWHNDIRIAGETEISIFKALGLPWVPPEDRNRSPTIPKSPNAHVIERMMEIALLYRTSGDMWRARAFQDAAHRLKGIIDRPEIWGARLGRSTAETALEIYATGTCERLEMMR